MKGARGKGINASINPKNTKDNYVQKKKGGSANMLMAEIRADHMILIAKASEIFTLDLSSILYGNEHKNVINGINYLIKTTKIESGLRQKITKNINLDLELGMIINLLNRQDEKDYSYKINYKTKTLSLNLVVEGVRFEITINEKKVSYNLIISDLVKNDIAFQQGSKNESVYCMKGEILTMI